VTFVLQICENQKRSIRTDRVERHVTWGRPILFLCIGIKKDNLTRSGKRGKKAFNIEES